MIGEVGKTAGESVKNTDLGPAAEAGVVDDLGAALEVEFLHGVRFVGFDGLDADG